MAAEKSLGRSRKRSSSEETRKKIATGTSADAREQVTCTFAVAYAARWGRSKLPVLFSAIVSLAFTRGRTQYPQERKATSLLGVQYAFPADCRLFFLGFDNLRNTMPSQAAHTPFPRRKPRRLFNRETHGWSNGAFPNARPKHRPYVPPTVICAVQTVFR